MSKYKVDPRDGKAEVPPGLALARYLVECAEAVYEACKEQEDLDEDELREQVDAFIDDMIEDLVESEELPEFPDVDDPEEPGAQASFRAFYEAALELDLKQYLVDHMPEDDD